MTAVAGPVPAGRYVAATWIGDTVVTAGMTPKGQDERLLDRGVVGLDVPTDRGRALAAAAADRAVAAVLAVAGAGARDGIPTELVVYVRATPEFEEHSAVADGASERIADAFGGRLPARAAIGVQSLPGGAPVEVVLRVHVPRVSSAFPSVSVP